MGFYEALQTAKFAPAPDAISPDLWNNTRGKVIMEKLNASTVPMPFLEDRIAAAMDLYQDTMKNHWTWKPQGASGTGAGLLDQSNLLGECAQLVSGFKALLRAPEPYGLGLDDQDVSSKEWPEGGQIVLFVVNHKQPHFGLHANVLKPDWAKYAGATRFQDLYAWGNHKVLKVNCAGRVRYFDPCYNHVYLLPEEMADWVLTQAEMQQMPKGGPVVGQYRGKDRVGRPVTFRAVGGATPEILQQNIRTLSNDYPVLIGPV
jgi:hypothetical protein